MSFAPMVRVNNEQNFVGNGLRFATSKEAQLWADGLKMRWYLVSETRVDESTDPVNYRTEDGLKIEEVV
jgi:hypothetical protein